MWLLPVLPWTNPYGPLMPSASVVAGGDNCRGCGRKKATVMTLCTQLIPAASSNMSAPDDRRLDQKSCAIVDFRLETNDHRSDLKRMTLLYPYACNSNLPHRE
ncbi:hypothetical protein L1887_36526 [Cichorium endivia]|nr:hypothetical protein L1887_36526 [Cichorium endivia]